MTTRGVLLLGSTGSIGTQALDVVRANPERFRVTGLAAGGSTAAGVALLAEQVAEFAVPRVAVAGEAAAAELRGVLRARSVAAEAQHGESDSGCVSARGPRSGAPGDVHQVGNRHLGARRHRSRDGLIERERVPSMTRPAHVRNDDFLAISNSWRVGLLPPELSQQNPRRVLQP